MTNTQIPLKEAVGILPHPLLKKLLRKARKLPESARARFLRNVAERLTWIVTDHPRTIVYSALGWAVGAVLDHVLAIPIPFTKTVIHLTADRAHEIAPVLGGVLGFFEDRTERMNRHRVARVIREEFARAAGTASH
jgi:hypothetical protein